jgi:hypothetical protein
MLWSVTQMQIFYESIYMGVFAVFNTLDIIITWVPMLKKSLNCDHESS